MDFAGRLHHTLKELGAPASGARQAYKNAIFTLSAEVEHLKSRIWDRRVTNRGYKDYRARYHAFVDAVNTLQTLLNLLDGIRPEEPPKPKVRVPEL